MKIGIFVFAGALAVSGCAFDTGVQSAGPGVYMLSARHAPIRGGAVDAQRDVMAQAGAFCANQQRKLTVVQAFIPPEENPFGPTSFNLSFRCD